MRKLILYTKEEDYFKDILNNIGESKTKACYVSFNKSSKFLKQELKKNKINDDIFIIDAITNSLSKKKQKNQKNIKFIPVPYRLDKISDTIKKAIKEGYNLIILDSLSNLLAYYSASDGKILIDFINSFINDKKEIELLFIVKREDENYPLIQGIYSFFKTYQKKIILFGSS